MLLNLKKTKYPFFKQFDTMDCGPNCLKMISKFYGKDIPIDDLRTWCSIGKSGVSFDGLSDAAEQIHLHSIPVLLPFDTLANEVPLPCIAHWNQKHFVVIYEINDQEVIVGDPAVGIVAHDRKTFIDGWAKENNNRNEGHLLLLEPTHKFSDADSEDKPKKGLNFLWGYFKGFKAEKRELLLGMLFGSLLQLLLPFLTQAVVDYGINLKDIGFVYLILLAQVVIFLSRASVELIRGWILLYLTSKINIRLVSDFLLKMIALPLSFFDTRNTGDIIQRINDNHKIETFLSSTSLTTFFSFFNIVIFSFVLLYYSAFIFLVFLIGSAIYVFWSLMFFKKREEYDHQTFGLHSNAQNRLIQLVWGIEDIKLNGSQRKRRWEWEDLQIKLFKVSAKSLKLEQKQSYGATLINELKNIFITFIAAKLVIDGEMTLGMLLAVQYILGQLNLPLSSLIDFLKIAQDAKLSLSRLTQVHHQTSEEDLVEDQITDNIKGDIRLQNVSFRYGPSSSPLVLKEINLTIPENKTTAIVGVSGSGKTTLFKVLLSFYKNYSGQINIGNEVLDMISPQYWRSICGAVLQDGYIFNDSLASNICESEKEELIDQVRLKQAVEIANLTDFIDNIPNRYEALVGEGGISLSGGEKQRLLIARAVYKNPQYLFFDEATSALDANNEKTIMGKLAEFYKNKTVLIIAHRLSTVKNADNIVVIDDGSVVEQGTHKELNALKGHYHTLVKNQLELGN